jgi:hypothetical protein
MAAEPRMPDELATPRLPGRPFVMLVGGVLMFLGLSVAGLWGVFTISVPNRLPLPAHEPPPPRLQSNPPADLARVLAQQSAALSGYRWVDRGKGLVSIPIDRAMTIIAARGPDAYAPIPGAPPMPPRTPAPQSGQPPRPQP